MSKSTKSTTQNQPPAWLQDQLQSFFSGAQGLMGGDPSKLVAPFNPEQESAFQNIGDMAGHQFGQSDIDQYMSPYQQDVIDATQKQLQLGDAQQQNSLKGNQISEGAYGGDRSAVMASELAGQQDTANNATIAGLENQGYSQALTAYETANQQKMQEYMQQLQAGTLQQQNAQQIIDAPYQQYDFLGNLFGDIGGLFGGTSTTTQQMPFTIKEGGTVPHMDAGGSVPNIFAPFGLPEGMAQPGRGGRATLNVKSAPAPAPQSSGLSDLVGMNSALKGLGVDGGFSGIPKALGISGATAPAATTTSALGQAIAAPAAAASAAPAAAAIGADAVAAPAIAAAADTSAVGLADLLPMIFLAAKGGRIPKRSMGGLTGLISPKSGMLGLAPQHLDDGGDVTDDSGPLGATALTQEDTPPNWQGLVTNYGQAVPSDTTTPAPAENPTWDDGTSVIGQSKGLADASAADQSKGISAAGATQKGPYGTPEYSPSPWLPIATGLLGALASRSVSKGALAGLSAYEEEAHPVVDHSGTTVHVRYANGPDFDSGVPTEAALNMRATQAYHSAALGERQAAIDAANQRHADSLAQTAQTHQDSEADRKTQERLAYINAGMPVPPELQDTGTAAPTGASDPFAAFATTMQGAENSTGNPAAKNPLSSATGNGQFIDQTWLNVFKAVHPDLAATMSPQQILGLRANPTFSTEMTEAYAKQNAPVLASAGQPVTSATLALAHRFGPQGAVSVLKSPPDAPMASILPPAVIQANPTLARQTAGQYVQGIAQQFGNTPMQPAASQAAFIPPHFLSDPQLLSGVDAKGVPQQVLAQQDKRSGQWITADDKRSPVTLSNLRILPASAASGSGQGSRAEVYFNRVVSAGNEAAAAARNIMELPSSSSSGFFSGRGQEPGLLNAAKESLTNKMTSPDVQAYNTMIAGVSRNLAAIEASGLAPSGNLTHSMDSIILKEGDTEVTKMRKMAEMRQIVEKGLEPNLANPRIPPEQKQLVQGIIKQMQDAIPFTQHDITQLVNSKNPKATIMDVAKANKIGTASGAPKFQEGQIYKDKNGNRAKYSGGKWTAIH